MSQTTNIRKIVAAAIVCATVAGWAAKVSANPLAVTVTDVTDWGTTPMETVNANLPLLGYYGGVYAGINTLSVNDGTSTTVYSGFCVDPFHWSLDGTVSGYTEVPLANAPKSPATLNASTAVAIADLWAEYFSPTMSPSSAAGLQIAIWEVVSSNAVASDGLSPGMAFSLQAGQYDYGASVDLASLATYDGPEANLIGLTGPGQDYVVDPPPSAPDGGATFLMFAVTLGGLFIARPGLIKSAAPARKMQTVRAPRR